MKTDKPDCAQGNWELILSLKKGERERCNTVELQPNVSQDLASQYGERDLMMCTVIRDPFYAFARWHHASATRLVNHSVCKKQRTQCHAAVVGFQVDEKLFEVKIVAHQDPRILSIDDAVFKTFCSFQTYYNKGSFQSLFVEYYRSITINININQHLSLFLNDIYILKNHN